MEPTQFGKFLIVDKIAQGGMAEIYKAKVQTSEGTLRTVAIKKILDQYSKNEDFITLLTDEAELMVTLNHPNIVPVIEFGAVDKDYYLALEYIQGVNLKDLLERAENSNHQIPLEVCAFIIREVCQGLDYAHRKKNSKGKNLRIIHRDISPTNVLLSYSGEVKIVDFGISKAASHSHVTQTGIIRGKMGYMSPEQTKSYLDIDGRSDLYSAGILLYEIVTGKRLFPAENINDAIKLVRKGNIPKPVKYRKEIAPFLEEIIMKSLKYEVKERIQSAARMRDLLNEFLAGLAIKQNYSKIFSISELGTYLQHIFKESYEKEIDRLDFEGKESSRSIRFMHKKKYDVVNDPNLDSSQSLVTNPKVHDSTTGEIKDKGIYYLRSKKYSKKNFKPAGLSLKVLVVVFAVILGTVIIVSELFVKPKIGTLIGSSKFSKRITFNVLTKPSGAKVYINSEEILGVTPLNNIKVPLKRFSVIRVEKEGYKTAFRTFEPTIDKERTAVINLEELNKSAGNLIVFSEPQGAKIVLDGEETGKMTPSWLSEIDLGREHEIKLLLDGYKSSVNSIKIGEKAQEYLNVKLIKTGS